MTDKPVILIVDDEVTNIEVICAILEEDYELCFALSGAQAVTVAHAARPDLILLDIVMPEMDGYLLCRRLKDDPDLTDIPIIFTTALDEPEAEVRGLSLGAIDFVTKPFRPVVLRQRVANHIQLKRLRDQLARQAMTDPLTGLANRRQLEWQLSVELRRLARGCGFLSVIMLDIDHFKLLNDTYGHPEGDRCLRRIATLLSDSMRHGQDLCVRYGGEEFACILPDTDHDGAAWIAESIRARVEDLAFPNIQSSVGPTVTVSMGFVSGVCTPDGTADMWLTGADRMLYRSKAGGRNRVTGQTLEGDALPREAPLPPLAAADVPGELGVRQLRRGT